MLFRSLEEGDTVDTDATFGEEADEDAEEGGRVLSLMYALERSVRKRRGEDAEGTKGSGAKSSSGATRSSRTTKTSGGTKKSGTKKKKSA